MLTLVVTLTAACSSTSPVTEADLPVQLVNNLLFVPVRVGSSEVLSFILDTGASATVVDRTVAERLGLDLHASENAGTGGGPVQTASATGITLFVGNASLPDLRRRLRVPGQRFALTLKRGDTTIERIITTRRLI